MSPSREELRQMQMRLLASLVGDAEAPQNWDPSRLAAQAEALRHKRRRELSHAWPALTAALGKEFNQLFVRFARSHGLPSWGGPLADGLRFAQYLAGRDWPDAVQLELLRVSLRYRQGEDGLGRRTGPCIRVRWLSERGAVVIAAQWGQTECWLSVPWVRRGPVSPSPPTSAAPAPPPAR